jgi:hypothetical protein
MFASDSRYIKLTPYTVTLRNGQTVQATRLWVSPAAMPLAGYHTRVQGDRLDNIAVSSRPNPLLAVV